VIMPVLPTATSPEEAGRAAGVALLPVGSFEQHGAHLPLTTDTLVACAISDAIAGVHAVLVLPPVTVSCSHEHAGWAGTVSISATTLAAVVTDIAESLHRGGVDRLVVVNAHGGNYVLSNVVQQGNTAGPRMALFPTRTDWDTARRAAGMSTSAHEDMHAGELETSLLLHAHPDLVRDGYQNADHVAERPHLLVHGMREYTATGVIGRPSLATAEKGRIVLANLTEAFTGIQVALRPAMDAPESSRP